ncbi:bifunctional metallophosphatase/5'-nucleotidase [Sporosarcina limicola]|uniref:2',3'-cyclic-nucleotide 2'-phosphodiesterase (5'-nucleotidase family) n=1 Tax=Sporosarcina limicola TaxID=34101 RepID=A0A927MNJ9_9BACL|nr:bifunctional UDP-sugar hydrolase/5'-nucleotidase [Sporosarcina limicola]MBE1556402.1 2',3'-cyclic-nucleotide 2'-phosphodiesterase (5'-nucleotidase family) [Sporosarcina limicola]
MNKKHIHVLATSDIHGYVMPTKFAPQTNEALGLAKVATLIKKKRLQAPMILIDNGDFIQGSPMTYYQQKYAKKEKNTMIETANALHYDALVFGNHEFNYGMEVLQQAIQQSKFPWLAANIQNEQGEVFTKPYLIKEIEGIRLAILGVTTHFVPIWEVPKHIEGIHFQDAFEATRRWTNYIRQYEKVDILIVSYHGGFERDFETGELVEEDTGENQGYRICKEIDGIDVFISGHQHREIATKLFGKSIVQSGTKGVCLASVELTIELNDQQQITSITHEPSLIYVEEETAVDATIARLTAPIYHRTEKWLDETMGTIKGDIRLENAFDARVHEHPYVEFINRIQMDVSGAPISTTSLFHDEGGGLPNEVTMRDIVTNYIYPNTLKVLRVSGYDILQALEQCASYFTIEDEQLAVSSSFKYPKAQPYNYDMWEGIEYTYNISMPVGERVTRLTRNGQPIDLQAKFDVVMNSYRATGAGHFDMFKNRPVIKDIQTDMTEIIADYFQQHPVIEATCNHNWEVIY